MPLVAQALVDGRERELDRDADVVADTGRGCACAAAVRPSMQMISAPERANAGGDCCDVVHARDLDHDRLFVLGRFLEREHQLAQVLDRVDVMVRGGGDGVRTLGDHTGAGDVRANLVAGQVE